MAKTTFSGPVRSKAGFFNIVPNPSNPSSLQLASFQSAAMQVRAPFVFSALTQTVVIPAGVFITGIDVYVGTAFNGTTPTIKIGSAAAGADILAASAIATAVNTQYLALAPLAAVTGNLFVTLAIGGSTAGAGTLVVHYAY